PIDLYLLTFNNTLQDKVLNTNKQYTNLTSYVQYTAPTHLAYATTLAHFTSNIDDTALTQPTSFVAPDADNTLIQYASPTCPMSYPSEPSLPMSDDTLQDDESDDDQPLELVSRFTFANWDRFKKWLDRFALKEGFDYKIRTSEKEQGILRRVAYECTKSSSHNPQITLDPIKHCNAFSSRVLCS
ncbi:hypothetical protein RhiirC2_802451, partial [Rhizophagus irregularis]